MAFSYLKLIGIIFLSACTIALAPAVLAQISSDTSIYTSESLDKFTPRPSRKMSIDYRAWSDLLQVMVLPTGQSTRQSAPKATASTGTRLVISNRSPYRLEGNKVAFSKFNLKFTALITEYRRELENLGTKVNISTLPENEQLAFWLNLHNVTVIEQLALAYPEVTPVNLKIGSPPTSFHESKILKINNTKLSLRDIREKIVYKNWSNSAVMYGFFLGDIGSPSIQNYAFNAENIYTSLDIVGYEFANSLRGFKRGRVSKIYEDNSLYFFPNFQSDLRAHLEKYMRDDVIPELNKYDTLLIAKYEYTIADIVGGRGNRTTGLPVRVSSNDSLDGVTVGNDLFTTFLSELREKQKKLERMGLTRRGTVIIEDIETITENN